MQVAEPLKKPVEDVEVVAVVVPEINDSSAGLAQMYNDLAPQALRVRSAAISLLFFSCLFFGTLEGFFGVIAAMGVLCCAAPGSLGTAHACRCTRITACMAATLSFMHILCLSTFALAVKPSLPGAFHHVCGMERPQQPAGLAVAAAPSASIESLTVIVADEGDLAAPSQTAHFVATVAYGVSRRLQEFSAVVEDDGSAARYASCVHAQRMVLENADMVLLLAAMVEFGLFFSALNTMKQATKLVLMARRYGANGI